jgi:Tol biopolymer transport system component/DNA-binding winged helix-turn-helix (wHTH) protein
VHRADVKLRFGAFEADVRTGELRKSRIRIKIQSQPFKLLVALLERPGQLVTREELRQLIWGDATAVDFDHSLGTAINKLRDALSDSADNPRYIETLAKRGYRFIAPVQVIEPPVPPPTPQLDPIVSLAAAPLSPNPADSPPVPEPTPPPLEHGAPAAVVEPRRGWLSRALRPFAAIVGITVVATCFWLWRGSSHPTNVRFAKITWAHSIYPGDLGIERFPGMVTDGVRIYFPEIRDNTVVVAHASVSDGDTSPLLTPPEIARPAVADISRDGSKLLIRGITWSEMEQPLWIVPATGAAGRKVLSGLAHDATWLPDGKSILYASGRELWITQNDGTEPRKLVTLPGRAFWMRYSPNGSHIRFTILDASTRATSIWEVTADGRDLRPLFPDRGHAVDCCGNWTRDGRHFVFQSGRDGLSDIWARSESWGRRAAPVQITSGPLSYIAPSPSRADDRIFVIGAHTRSQLSRFDAASNKFVRYLPSINTAGRTELSPDGSRVAWISTADATLWRSRVDGAERLQLTSRPMRVYMMRWSPDASKIVLMGKYPGKPWKIYIISSDGGAPQPITTDDRSEADPDWSPDGQSIMFGRPPDYMSEDATQKAIQIVNLETRRVTTLPGSAGTFSPRWSPDGRYVAAMPLNQRKLMVFDVSKGTWAETPAAGVHNPAWSKDSRSIFFQTFMADRKPVYRYSVADGRTDLVADFHEVDPANTVDFWGITPLNEPIVSIRAFAADVYAIEWDNR